MISIVIPVWKTLHLRRAIDSVLGQKYTDFELIIVEGKRLDDFDQILKMYPDPRIYVKRHNPIPIVENWNNCMKYATGEFSILLCDDDSFDENHLLNLVNLSKKYPNIDLFHSRIRIIDKHDNLSGFTLPCSEFETAADFIYLKEFYNRPQYVSDFMYRTSKFRDSGGFVERPMAWYTDVDTAYAMAIPHGVAYSKEATFNYRDSEENVSSNLKPVQALEAVRLHYENLLKILEILPDNDIAYERRKLILHHLPKLRDKAYAANYTRTGMGRYPFAPLVDAVRYRNRFPVSLGRALLASAFALVQEKNLKGS